MTQEKKQLTTAERFDLDSFSDAQTGRVFIKNPVTGAPTPMYIEFAGPEHPERKKRMMNHQREMRQHMQKTGKIKLKDPIDDDNDNLDMLVACSIGWDLATSNGEGAAGPAFSQEAVRKLLADPKKRWLRDQMQAGFDERETFIVRSDAS